MHELKFGDQPLQLGAIKGVHMYNMALHSEDQGSVQGCLAYTISQRREQEAEIPHVFHLLSHMPVYLQQTRRNTIIFSTRQSKLSFKKLHILMKILMYKIWVPL